LCGFPFGAVATEIDEMRATLIFVALLLYLAAAAGGPDSPGTDSGGGGGASGSGASVAAAAARWWRPQRYSPDGNLTRFQYQLSDEGTITYIPGVQVGCHQGVGTSVCMPAWAGVLLGGKAHPPQHEQALRPCFACFPAASFPPFLLVFPALKATLPLCRCMQ